MAQENRIYSARWYSRPENQRKSANAKRAYNIFVKKHRITPDTKEQIWIKQEKACLICGKSNIKPQLDHQDTPHRLRGILCITCNTTLGKFNHDPEMFYRIARYLETAEVNLNDFTNAFLP